MENICHRPFNLGNWGKTLTDYYLLAKQNEKNGFLINAYTYARNASDLILEDDDIKLEWKEGDDIKNYSAKLGSAILDKYNFPLVLSKIHTKPVIISIEPKAILNNIVPTINYHSTMSMNNKAELEKEKNAIKRELQKTFTDLNFNGAIVFRVYETPEGTGRSFYFIDKE